MSDSDDSDKGICILSLDSGGPGTYSQLLIVKEYMRRLAIELGVDGEDLYPADYFDMMGGVGLGGLSAFMLGYLRMTVDQALDAILTIVSAVFPYDPEAETTAEINTRNLVAAIEDMLQAIGVPLDTKLNDKRLATPKCRVIMYAANSVDISHPRALRTYHTRGSNLDPTVVQALCATMATPSLFEPVKIGPRLREESFISGALGANNPTRELIKEAAAIFGENKRVAQVLSLGTGRPGPLPLDALKDKTVPNHMLKTLYLDCETVAVELSTRLFNVDAYCRLNAERMAETSSMTDWSGIDTIESKTVAYMEEPVVSRDIRESIQYILTRTGTATLGQINASSSTKLIVKIAPPVSPYFTERKTAWDSLIKHLLESPPPNQNVLAITGMGGCGKTQLMSYFLQEKGSSYTHIVFVNANSSFRLKADLQAWAQSLGVDHEQDVWEDALRLLANDNSKWLLVLDNADDPTMDLASFLPKCYNGTIVITSRNRDVGNLANSYHLELGEMENEEAISTLFKASRRQPPISEDLESAQELTKLLGYLPVALVQAGTYCHQLSTIVDGEIQLFTFAQYISIFVSQCAVLMKNPALSLDNYQLGAYTAFEISYKVIPDEAKDFLHFAATFQGSEIALRIFSIAAERKFADPTPLHTRPSEHYIILSRLTRLLCIDGEWDELKAHKAIHTLRSFSLISASSASNTIFLHLHPLVQSWARDMPDAQKEPYPRMAIQVLTSCSSQENLLISRYLLPHIQDILDRTPDAALHPNEKLALGVALKDEACFDQAVRLFKQIIEEFGSDPDGVPIQAAVDRLASTYREMGRWTEAETLAVAGLQQALRIYGEEHRDTFTAAGNLGFIYNYQGRYKEAESLEEMAFRGYQRVLGVDDPATLRGAGNLACTYRSLNKTDKAIEIQKEVLERRRKVLGRDHPDTATAAESLSFTYCVVGDYSQAEELVTDGLEERRKRFGRNHLTIVRTAHNLGVIYRYQRRFKEAEELLSESLQQKRRILGRENPTTLETAEELAKVYKGQERYHQAEELQKEVLDSRQRKFGLDHVGTLFAETSLASTYEAQGRFADAARLLEDALIRRRRTLGPNHSDTIAAAGNLAVNYTTLGRYKEAVLLQAEVLASRREIPGMEDPETLRIASNLASMKRSSGDIPGALELNLEILEIRRRLFGEDNPDTITSENNLALVYRDLNRYEEAEILQREVLEKARKAHGNDNIATLAATNNLALSYLSQDRYSQAEELQVDLLASMIRVFGTEHPRTILSRKNLACNYRSQGRYKEAGELYREAYLQSRKVQGDDHPDTNEAGRSLVACIREEKIETLENLRETLGQEHPDTLAAMTSLAQLYENLGQWDEAEPLLIEAITVSIGSIGKDHAETQDRLSALARVLTQLDRFEDFEDIVSMLS